jgi:hypothetical protein
MGEGLNALVLGRTARASSGEKAKAQHRGEGDGGVEEIGGKRERESKGSTVGEDAPSSRHSDHKAALPTPKKNLREEEDGDGFLDLTTVNEGEELILDIDFRAQDNEEEDGAVGQPAVAASSAADPVATSSNGLQHHSPQ